MIDEPQARGAVTALVQQGMEAGGPPPATERLRLYAAGDANWERLPDDLRRRMQVSAETFFDIELGSHRGYLPDDETLAAIAAPVLVLASEGNTTIIHTSWPGPYGRSRSGQPGHGVEACACSAYQLHRCRHRGRPRRRWPQEVTS
jgi:hypothetical protein